MTELPPNLTWTRAGPPEAAGPGPWIEIAFGEGDDGDTPVYLRETSAPATVVTTTRRKWDAFVLGVQAGEFDHFVDGRGGSVTTEITVSLAPGAPHPSTQAVV